MVNFLGPILRIVEESLVLINEDKRRSIKKELRGINEEIYRLENLPASDFDDDLLTRSYDKLFIFLKSYSSEISRANQNFNT